MLSKMHENGAVCVLYDETTNIGRAQSVSALAEKNYYIKPINTRAVFHRSGARATGRGYRHGLQAWAGASKGAKTPKK